MGLTGFAVGLGVGYGVMYALGYHFSSDTSFATTSDSAQMYEVMRAEELNSSLAQPHGHSVYHQSGEQSEPPECEDE